MKGIEIPSREKHYEEDEPPAWKPPESTRQDHAMADRMRVDAERARRNAEAQAQAMKGRVAAGIRARKTEAACVQEDLAAGRELLSDKEATEQAYAEADRIAKLFKKGS